jgi:hypothetical protein
MEVGTRLGEKGFEFLAPFGRRAMTPNNRTQGRDGGKARQGDVLSETITAWSGRRLLGRVLNVHIVNDVVVRYVKVLVIDVIVGEPLLMRRAIVGGMVVKIRLILIVGQRIGPSFWITIKRGTRGR